MDFNGDRLRIARIYRNMTISDLEDKISVTKQAISQYEKGVITPKAEVVFQMIAALGFPLAFFTEKDNIEPKVENTFFRALSSARALDLGTQEIKAEIIIRLYNFLNGYLNFPILKLPDIELYENMDIEEAALNTRSFWGMREEPITNMVALLEKNGIIVSSLSTDTNSIDAFTHIHTLKGKQQICVVLGNDKQSMVRRNFDAAHELGHIILHKHLINVKDLSNEEFKRIEFEANHFAASFLMPKNSFFADLDTPTNLDSYLELKKKWKVSVAAMVMRSKQLGRINSLQYQNLMKLISYKKWRKGEPFDSDWEIQRPQLFQKAIKILKDNDRLTGHQLIAELSKYKFSIYAEEIEGLLDLDPGTLCENADPVDDSFVLSIKKEKENAIG